MKSNSLKRIFLLGFILSLMLTFALPCFASTIQLTLDGKPLKTTVSPIQKNDITLVPIRIISENLGADVAYDAASKEVVITTNVTSIKLYLNQTAAKVNGETITLGTAPQVIRNTTMVPIRFISEHLNCTVTWDSSAQLVAITSKSSASANNTSKPTDSSLPTATIKVKDYGTITLELYPKLAPNTVNNFIALANSGFYNSLTFHRVIKDFMIQGGDPLGNGTGGPDYAIAGEFAANGFSANTLSHTKGIISMARSASPNSAGSQFFITSSDATYLDGQYAAFGKVIAGFDIVEAISVASTDMNDAPLKPIVIEGIKVDTHDITYSVPIKITD